MAIDIYRINALIDLLLWEGEDFDPDIACELFGILPRDRHSWLEFHWVRNRKDSGIEGLTNTGTVSPGKEETGKEAVSFGASAGTWIGKWRVIRTATKLIIEPRFFAETAMDGRGEYFVLPFKNGKPQDLYKSGPLQIRIPVPFLGTLQLIFYRLVKWKSPAAPQRAQTNVEI